MRSSARVFRAVSAAAAVLLASACGGGAGGSSGVVPSGPTSTSTPAPTPTPMLLGPSISLPIHGLTPSLVAFQSGTSGGWTAVTPNAGKVTLTLATGATSYSVAALCPVNHTPFRIGPAEVVIQATTSDSPSIFCEGPVPGTVSASLLVDTSAFPNTDTFGAHQVVNWGVSGPGFGAQAGGDAIGSPLWEAGPADLVMTVYSGSTPVAGRIVRNVSMTSGASLTLPPMSSADAVTTAAAQVPAGTNTLDFWAPAEGGMIFLGTGGSANIPVIPAASSQAGDYYEVGSTGSVGGQFVAGAAAASSPASITTTLPGSALTVPVPAPADLPVLNLAYSGFTISGTRYYSLVESYTTAAAPIAAGAPLITVVASQGYLGTSTTVAVPDLSSVPGTLPAPSGIPVNVIGNDYAATGAMPWDDMEIGNAYFVSPLAVGTQFQTAQSQGTISYTAP